MTQDKFNAQESISPINKATTAEAPQASRRRFMASAVALAVGAVLGRGAFSDAMAADSVGPAEKPQLTLGFIKLTDMAPLAIAYEKGFFQDEGLFVSLQAQANWKVLLDGVIGGSLDGAHMLAGQPLAATIGFGSKAHLVTPFSMDLNGNAITVSNSVWKQM
ncbi:MAG: nitrate ABC transporter substrate-binding protein, partial [Halothiobacillus sp. 13-55-115]